MTRVKRSGSLAEGLRLDVRSLRRNLRSGARSAVVEIEGRRARLQASLEKQLAALGRTVLRQLHAAREAEVTALRRRVTDLEGRTVALERRLRARSEPAGGGGTALA